MSASDRMRLEWQATDQPSTELATHDEGQYGEETNPLSEPEAAADEQRRWLDALHSFIQGRRSVHTRRAYTESLEQFLTFLKGRGRTLATATPADVGAFVDSLQMGPPRGAAGPALAGPPEGEAHPKAKQTSHHLLQRSSGTAQNRVTAISSFYGYCIRSLRLTTSNPCDAIEWPRATHRTRSALPLPHAQALLQEPARAARAQAAARAVHESGDETETGTSEGGSQLRLNERRVARDRLILGLMMIEGLREAEVAALRLEAIRRVFDRAGEMYIAVDVAGKGSKLRSLVLADSTVSLLETYLDAQQRKLGESGPLFPSAGPRRPRNPRTAEWVELLPPAEDHLSPTRIRQLVYDYARRVLPPEMRIGPHHLRHTAVTDWLDAGAGLREAQLHAGHSSPVTTQSVYDHASLRPEQSASRKGRLGQTDAEQQPRSRLARKEPL